VNELLTRKHIKKVMRRGVSKIMAKEIVESAIDASKGKENNIDMYIDYALNLTYGFGSTSTNRNTKA